MAHRHRKFHLLVVGTSGYGKSTYAEKFIAHAPGCPPGCPDCKAGVSCRFIFDPDGDFADDMGLEPVYTASQIDAAVKTGYVCYDPSIMFPGDTEAGVDFLARYAFERSKRLPGRKLFVMDEMGTHCPNNTIPLNLKVAVQRGRHEHLDCVFIAQTPNEIHNSIRVQVTEVVCFNLDVEDGLAQKFLVNRGFDLDELRQLPPFHYICRNKRGGETRGY